MDWVKLLTAFESHPKTLSVGNAGAGLYARSLAYCGAHETDGQVPKAWADQAVAREGQQDLPGRLVAAGLWIETESGFEIRDFTEVNRTHEAMEALRKKRARAGKRGGKQPGSKPEANGKQNQSKSLSLSTSKSSSFSEWLTHYRETTGKTSVRGSRPARESFNARLGDGYSLEELKLATVGCHGDEFCRENGHDVPETILRASKVNRYIQLAQRPAGNRSSPAEQQIAELEARHGAVEGHGAEVAA